MVKRIETIERGIGWPANKWYVHIIIDLDKDSSEALQTSKKTIDSEAFRELFKEGGWFEGKRKILDEMWPYVFRVTEV